MSSPGDAAGASLARMAVLSEGTRWRLYAFIRAARRPVSREEAAASAGISRKLAAFHLDKLVTAGLLRARYEPAPGLRRVGRAPKTYEPTGTDVTISVPPRRHDVLAGVLIDAILAAGAGGNAWSAAIRVARVRGGELGADQRDRLRPGRLGAERALTLAGQILDGCGFDPQRETPAALRLRNCPFHPLAGRAPDLVCAINHAYLSGMLEGLGATAATAVLDPEPGSCCVVLTSAAT